MSVEMLAVTTVATSVITQMDRIPALALMGFYSQIITRLARVRY